MITLTGTHFKPDHTLVRLLQTELTSDNNVLYILLESILIKRLYTRNVWWEMRQDDVVGLCGYVVCVWDISDWSRVTCHMSLGQLAELSWAGMVSFWFISTYQSLIRGGDFYWDNVFPCIYTYFFTRNKTSDLYLKI